MFVFPSRWWRSLGPWAVLWLGSAWRATAAITIATYNIENYTLADRIVDGVYRPAYPKPEDEKTALRQAIRGLDADVLALQEMGPKLFLEELQRDLKTEGVEYPQAVLLEAADPDRHVAVLSKWRIKEVHRHARVPLHWPGHRDVMKRGVLELVFATSTGDLTLFIVHLKSRRTEDAGDPEGAQRRLHEAEAVRELVRERCPDPARQRFVVCGDWNDAPDSKPVRSLVKHGDFELGAVLAAADSRGEGWTHFYRRDQSYSRIDYVLVSPALHSAVTGGCAQVYDGPGVERASDHRPVQVRLELEGAR